MGRHTPGDLHALVHISNALPALYLLLAMRRPNATLHLPPEAGARDERRLEAVRCKRLFGKAPRFSLPPFAPQHLLDHLIC
jgi:hypothetical protein